MWFCEKKKGGGGGEKKKIDFYEKIKIDKERGIQKFEGEKELLGKKKNGKY